MKYFITIMFALVSVAAIAAFTDIDSPQYYGKTNIPKTHAAIDANFAMIEGGTVTTKSLTSTTILGAESGNASVIIDADEGDDNADTWTIRGTASDNDLDFLNHTSILATLDTSGLLFVTVGLDGIGAVDMDYGSADITDHTFTTDSTGDAEIVLPNDSIGDAELDWANMGQIAVPAGAGAANGTGVAATEYGNGTIHQTVLTFTDVAIALTDEAGTIAYGSLKVYDLPEGAILLHGAVQDVALTKSSAGVDDDWNGDVGVGTTAADNDASLATTEQDIIPTTATPQAVSGVTTADGLSTTSELAIFDGTATAKDIYVNLLVDDADHDVTSTPCNLILNGTLTITWVDLGDK